MRVTRAFVRKAASWVAAVTVLPILGQFSVVVAEALGWFKNPLQKISIVTESLAALVANPWFTAFAGATVGFAAGVWLDAILRRKEREPLIKQVGTDLAGLAEKAEILVDEINALLAEAQNKSPTSPKYHSSDRSEHQSDQWQSDNLEIEEKLIRNYMMKCHSRASIIIETSIKYIKFIPGEMWSVSGVSSRHGVEAMANLLVKIAVRLREVVPANS